MISQSGIITDEHMSQLIEKLESRITNSLAKLITDATKPLLDKVAALESKVAVYEAHFKELDRKMEDLERRFELKVNYIEQYGCCSCLRFYGLPLPKGGRAPVATH